MFRCFLRTILLFVVAMPTAMHAYGTEPAAPSYAEDAMEELQTNVGVNKTTPCTLALTPGIIAMIGLPQDVVRPSRLRKTDEMACETR